MPVLLPERDVESHLVVALVVNHMYMCSAKREVTVHVEKLVGLSLRVGFGVVAIPIVLPWGCRVAAAPRASFGFRKTLLGRGFDLLRRQPNTPVSPGLLALGGLGGAGCSCRKPLGDAVACAVPGRLRGEVGPADIVVPTRHGAGILITRARALRIGTDPNRGLARTQPSP